jgi:hypothetical protein
MEMFAAVHAALAGGAAVGVFPEGISHSEPGLQTLRTGAARIALGAAALTGSRFPIVPIGLVYRDRRVFRSRAHVIVGQPVSWEELAGRAEADVEAVRILTGRIEAALRQITVNLEEWEDAPLVEAAEAVYAAEFGLSPDPVERITRMRLVTETLKELRRSDSSGWLQLAEDLRRHTRILKWYGFSPRSLHMQTGAGKVIGWSVRRLPLALVAASGVWLIGAALFWLPYTVTGYIGRRARQSAPVLESTAKFLGGGVVFILWICLLSAAVALAWNTRAGVLTLLILPPLALATLQLQEILSRSVREARRFLRIKGSRAAVSELRERQKELARRLDNLRSAAPR